MATRISLIRSIRQKEERGQIGNLASPFAKTLVKVEKDCLLRLSAAARKSNQIQIALNSVVRVQDLEKTAPTFEASQEFAKVLWLQKEQKLAVQFLKDLNRPGLAEIKKASLLACLVCLVPKTTNARTNQTVCRVHGYLKLAWKNQP